MVKRDTFDSNGRLVATTTLAVVEQRGRSTEGHDALLRYMRKSPSVLLMLSGCAYDDCGSAQRPSVLARELAGMGQTVVYSSTCETKTRMKDDVLLIGHRDLPNALSVLALGDGVVIGTLPIYYPQMRRLQQNGWLMGYDYLDDWAAFVAAGDLAPDATLHHEALLHDADFITTSARGLQEQIGRPSSLILNGGPNRPFRRLDQMPEGMADGRIRVVYVGYMDGSWFDWALLERIGKEPDMGLTVIGKSTRPVKPDITQLGVLPYAEAMRYVAEAHVGVIPFRGLEICAGVDPIKLYDHRAARIWTVATPEMTQIAGAEGVILAPRQKFVEEIRQAAALRTLKPISDEVITANSWRSRAKQMEDVIKEATDIRARRFAVKERSGLTYEDCVFKATWTGTAVCNAEPPCPYCCTETARAQAANTPLPDYDRVYQALLKMAEGRSPMLLAVCGGESMLNRAQVKMLGDFARYNMVDMVSNLIFPIEWAKLLPSNGNVGFACSFHGHLWGNDTRDFITKQAAIRAAGHRVGLTQIVYWPGYFEHIDRWLDEFRAAGETPMVLVFNGVDEATGKHYPQSYTEAEWEYIRKNTIICGDAEFQPDLAGGGSPAGRLCRCGKDYVSIDYDGTVYRCVIPMQDGSGVLGSLLDGFELYDCAMPCTATACPCGDLWQYIVD